MNNSAVSQAVYNDILSIRATRPLIHNITNFVVMNVTANALLALGASPIMAHAIEELPELMSISEVLVLNIGTLDKNWINNMAIAAQLASEKNKAIVLDPVGAGASQLRTESVLNLLKSAKITVLRGNASEIMALEQQISLSKGVDSTEKSERAIASAKAISKKFGCVVCVSGEIDYCISNDNILTVENGSSIMSHVTGMGCTATAIIAAFLAVNKNALEACYHAMICMGICGEIAASRSHGPGTFLPQFLDTLYSVDLKIIDEKINV